MTDSRDEHETYGHTESPVIAALQEQIVSLAAQRDEANKQADMLAHRNAVLVVELDELRKRYLEVRDRNTRLLSQMQELEAREQ